MVRRGAPLFESLRGFQASWLRGDALAGMTLAAIAIPEQLATAKLAGMAPETGLFAFAAGSLAFAVFGANRFMSVGADFTIAPIFAGTLAAASLADPARYGALAATLALLVGLILVISGIARAGWIADLLSIPVTTGFLAGISVHIIDGQLPAILGVSVAGPNLIARLMDAFRQLPEANPLAIAIGIGVLVLTLAAERISPKIPGALIGLLLAALAVWFFDLPARGVGVLGALTLTLPTVSLPALDPHTLLRLLPLALTVALVCMMQSAAVVRGFPSDPDGDEDVSRDFIGVGAGSLLAGVIGAFAVDFQPTAHRHRRPVRRPLPGDRPHRHRPHRGGRRSRRRGVRLCAPGGAGGILVFIGIRIFRLGTIIRIARRGGIEILLVLICAALVIALPIETGVGLAIVLSLVHSIYLQARPICVELERLPGTTIWWPPSPGEASEREPGVFVFAPAAPINFTNASYIRQALETALAKGAGGVRLVVIDASAVAALDYTGAQILIGLVRRLRARSVDVALARLGAERAMTEARRSGLLDVLGPNHLFHSVEAAVRALRRAAPPAPGA